MTALSLSVLHFVLGCQTPGAAAAPAAPAAPVGDASALPAPATPGAPVPWWDEPYPKAFDVARLPKKLDVLRVQGNHLVNGAGDTVVLTGVNISDPDKLERGGHFNRHHFEVIREWGANVVRVPVHPTAWRQRGKAAYLDLLDQTVSWATELDLYLIIDWHSIGNLVSELFQHPMYDTTVRESLEFWRTIAFRYKDVPTVAFYELFNEPSVRRGTLGLENWTRWKALNEEMISIIFAHDKRPIPLVAGFDWAYQLGPIAEQPIAREGIGYVSHPYPGKAKAPYEANWDQAFGFAAAKYPLFITEMGYMGPNDPGAHSPAIDDGSYGKRITDYLAAKGASWTAWCFDPDWPPQLISDWNYTPTASGAHFREVMLAQRAKSRGQATSALGSRHETAAAGDRRAHQ